MNKKLTITVGIPAYNEEKSIFSLVTSVLSQKQDGFVLEKILIANDGSTDRTNEIIASLKNKKIQIINGSKNMGRMYRRRQIIQKTTSDVLVFIDADGVLENSHSLKELLKPFKSKSVALVGGNPHSVGTENFLTKSLSIPRDIYNRSRYQIKRGNNVYGCMGGMLALNKELYSKIHLPLNISADDAYIYFSALSLGMKFVNAKKARVLHTFPATVALHIKRNKRHNLASQELGQYFETQTIAKEYMMPMSIILKETIKEFVRLPFHTMYVFGVNKYAKLLSKYEK